MTFDKAQIQALHKKLDAVLAQFAKDNDLVAGASAFRYSATDFKVTVNFSDKSANPDAVDPKFLMDLRRRGYQHGLTEEMVGKEVILPTSKGLTKVVFVGMSNSKAAVKFNGEIRLYPAEGLARYMRNPIA